LQELQPAPALRVGEGQDPLAPHHRRLPASPAAGRGGREASARGGAAAVRSELILRKQRGNSTRRAGRGRPARGTMTTRPRRVTDEDVMAHKGTQAILLQDVEKLGRKGDVVNVAAGYMRNYLEPRKLALAASDGMVAQVRRQEDLRRRHEAQSEEQAQEIAHTLNRTVLTIKARAGAEDRLYGSVTSRDIADTLSD